MIALNSSNLAAADYDGGTLYISFHGGRLYWPLRVNPTESDQIQPVRLDHEPARGQYLRNEPKSAGACRPPRDLILLEKRRPAFSFISPRLFGMVPTFERRGD